MGEVGVAHLKAPGHHPVTGIRREQRRLEREAQGRAQPSKRPLGVAGQILEVEAVHPPGPEVGLELQDALVHPRPDPLAAVVRGDAARLREDAVKPLADVGADAGDRMAHEVHEARAREQAREAPDHGLGRKKQRALVDEDPPPEAAAEEGIDLGRGDGALRPLHVEVPCPGSRQQFSDRRDDAHVQDRPPEVTIVGGHVREAAEIQLPRGEQPRVARQHDPEQRRARSRRRQDEQHGIRARRLGPREGRDVVVGRDALIDLGQRESLAGGSVGRGDVRGEPRDVAERRAAEQFAREHAQPQIPGHPQAQLRGQDVVEPGVRERLIRIELAAAEGPEELSLEVRSE